MMPAAWVVTWPPCTHVQCVWVLNDVKATGVGVTSDPHDVGDGWVLRV